MPAAVSVTDPLGAMAMVPKAVPFFARVNVALDVAGVPSDAVVPVSPAGMKKLPLAIYRSTDWLADRVPDAEAWMVNGIWLPRPVTVWGWYATQVEIS